MESTPFTFKVLSDFVRECFDWTRAVNVSNPDTFSGLGMFHPFVDFLLEGMAKSLDWRRSVVGRQVYTCEGQKLVEFYLLINLRRAMMARQEGIPNLLRVSSLLQGQEKCY